MNASQRYAVESADAYTQDAVLPSYTELAQALRETHALVGANDVLSGRTEFAVDCLRKLGDIGKNPYALVAENQTSRKYWGAQ